MKTILKYEGNYELTRAEWAQLPRGAQETLETLNELLPYQRFAVNLMALPYTTRFIRWISHAQILGLITSEEWVKILGYLGPEYNPEGRYKERLGSR